MATETCTLTRLPSTFYRYRAFDTRTLDSLCHDRLFFANPGTFNDPLDCNLAIECDSGLDELRLLLSTLIQRRVKSEVLASLSQARIKGVSAAAYAEKRALFEAQKELADIAYHATNPEYTDPESAVEGHLLVSEIGRELRKHYERGACCFSTTYSSPLLWSHYGDQHRGLCIGYSLDRRPKPLLQPVIYGGSRSVPTSILVSALVLEDRMAKEKLDRDMLLRKAHGWRYEKEWRLIDDQGDKDSPLFLKEVTFGMRCPMSVIHAVTKALAGRNAPTRYYEMHVVHGRFLLRRREVDLQELGIYLPNTAQSGVEIFGNPEELK